MSDSLGLVNDTTVIGKPAWQGRGRGRKITLVIKDWRKVDE